MKAFADIGVSIFDPAFTLDPYRYLGDLYAQHKYLGFRSDNMHFLFRFQQSRALMFNPDCGRATGDIAELQALEARYAELYPTRAWHYEHSYSHGDPDMTFKAAIGKFIATVAERASFAEANPIFARLGQGGKLNDYMTDIAKLPMRVFLRTCHLPFDEAQLAKLHQAGCDYLKSLDNFYDEELIGNGDAGLAVIRQYVETHFDQLDTGSPLLTLIAAGRKAGMSDEQLKANIGGTFLTAISNTVGMSSAFILRTLINDTSTLRQLKAHPALAQDDQVIMELLRRDNHVKALSRQVNRSFTLDGFDIPQGSLLYLFFPGINMDPAQWPEPTHVNFNRDFSGKSNLLFGGSFFTCIGRKLTMAFLRQTVAGFVRYLPETAVIDDAQIQLDGNWMAERIITSMPIQLS
jgi:cytochrome P450